MGNRTYSHLNKIGIAIIVVSVILLLFGLYILPSMGIFTAFVLFLLANWMKIDNKTKQEYDDFCDVKNKIKFGSTIEEVKSMMAGSFLFSIDESTSAAQSNICPTCGGKTIHGKCQYCGNEYHNEDNVTILNYSCRFGKQTFIFNNGKLDKIETTALPLSKFLIL